MEKEKNSPLIIVGALAIAFWPGWYWYVARTLDGSDEPWGLLALATAGWLIWNDGAKPGRGGVSLPVLVALLLVYIVASLTSPRLVQAQIALVTMGTFAIRWKTGRFFNVGLWGLLLLAAPVLGSLQFYLGYPLRVVSGQAAAVLLQLGGLDVVAEGTVLRWGELLVEVDAPCSGIRMLWTGYYLTFMLIALLRMKVLGAGVAMAATLVVLVAGNGLRAAALFYLEAPVVALPGWMHDVTGISCFLVAASLIVFGTRTIQERLV